MNTQPIYPPHNRNWLVWQTEAALEAARNNWPYSWVSFAGYRHDEASIACASMAVERRFMVRGEFIPPVDYEQEATELFEYWKGHYASTVRPADATAQGYVRRANYVCAVMHNELVEPSNTSGSHPYSTATVLLLSCKLEEHYRTQKEQPCTKRALGDSTATCECEEHYREKQEYVRPYDFESQGTLPNDLPAITDVEGELLKQGLDLEDQESMIDTQADRDNCSICKKPICMCGAN
jgi:hypothetical protein